MPRIKIGPKHARKRKRILRRASGFVASPGVQYRQALEFTRKAGHSAGLPVTKQVEEQTDIFSFLLAEVGAG